MKNMQTNKQTDFVSLDKIFRDRFGKTREIEPGSRVVFLNEREKKMAELRDEVEWLTMDRVVERFREMVEAGRIKRKKAKNGRSLYVFFENKGDGFLVEYNLVEEGGNIQADVFIYDKVKNSVYIKKI